VPLHDVLVDVRARRDQLGDRALTRVQLPQPLEPRQPVDDRTDRHGVVLVLHHAGGDLGVVQHPVDLLGGGGGIDRHRLRAQRPQREVEQRPLVTGPGHDGDPVAEPYAVRDQPLREREHLVPEPRGRHVPPLAGGVLAAERDPVRRLLGMVEHGVRQTADLRRRLDGRHGELPQ
jgi:hypothetical protein